MTLPKKSYAHLSPLAAAFMVFGALQYMVLEAITASAWHHPAYNYAVNFISDLGNPVKDDIFTGRTINSPLNVLMDIAFVTQGILFIAIALLLWRRVPGRVRLLLLILGLVHGIGIILVGIFHENSTVPVALIVPHFAGAAGAILGANVLFVVIGIIGSRVSAAPWYRAVSVALGLIGVAGFVVLQVDKPLYNAYGGVPERVAVYTIVAWEALTGLLLLVSRTRAQRAVLRADSHESE